MFAPDTSPYPALRRFYRAVDQRWRAQGADIQWARRLPGLMALAGLRQLGVATRSGCMGLGGVHDAFALTTIRQIGGVMVKDGDITQAELDEMVALFDDPAFVDVRSVFISVWGQKPLA